MRRKGSTGQESVMTGFSDGIGRPAWERSRSDVDMMAGSGLSQDDENMGVLVETVSVTLRRLREITRRSGRGTGKEVERSDEPWDCLTRIADLMKKAISLKGNINTAELVQT